MSSTPSAERLGVMTQLLALLIKDRSCGPLIPWHVQLAFWPAQASGVGSQSKPSSQEQVLAAGGGWAGAVKGKVVDLGTEVICSIKEKSG